MRLFGAGIASNALLWGLAPGGVPVTWAPEDLPIAVYLDREPYSTYDTTFTSADSIALWIALDHLMAQAGQQLFQPAMQDRIPLDTLPAGVGYGGGPPIVTRHRAIGIRHNSSVLLEGIAGLATILEECMGAVTWDQDRSCYPSGAIIGGEALFTNALPDVPEWAIHHEMLHILGLGHTCYHESVMNPGRCSVTPVVGTPVPIYYPRSFATPADLSALQEILEAKARERETSPGWGFLPSTQGERQILLGQDPHDVPLNYPAPAPFTLEPPAFARASLSRRRTTESRPEQRCSVLARKVGAFWQRCFVE
jgi:hypothetical protein